ncbi:hypothetical protein A0J57_18130 [Sphingobium sp. 22B]|uniref:hypothetical protein n=1 Tax=unclassified Sphingobium TaxID=2611147 RepID=UPI000786280C|nr:MULTISPECIES: hypothetical protein [unclassified Sphingobium]KXU29941.1 hypothetical protein AXW74_20390 [Sphingobium sp. AM]KYC30911.1 hypothetical protein A0J57_18130 [Sphingobium sp. 22B]
MSDSSAETVHFSFGTVERVLASLHHVAGDRRSAFANRIKNLQRLGYPTGTNTGRGRAAAYDIGALIRLVVVFEFLQIGLPPERAIKVGKMVDLNLLLAADLAVETLLSGDCDQQSRDFLKDYFILVDPMALNQNGETDQDFASIMHVTSCYGKELQRYLMSDTSHLAVVNFTLVFERTAAALYHEADIDTASFSKAVKQWVGPWAREVKFD